MKLFCQLDQNDSSAASLPLMFLQHWTTFWPFPCKSGDGGVCSAHSELCWWSDSSCLRCQDVWDVWRKYAWEQNHRVLLRLHEFYIVGSWVFIPPKALDLQHLHTALLCLHLKCRLQKYLLGSLWEETMTPWHHNTTTPRGSWRSASSAFLLRLYIFSTWAVQSLMTWLSEWTVTVES